jgi:penicillin-binding protein 1A
VLDALLREYPQAPLHRLAIVLAADEERAELYVAGVGTAMLGLEDVKWARRYIDAARAGGPPQRVNEVLAGGDVIYVRPVYEAAGEESGEASGEAGGGAQPQVPAGWSLGQAPKVQGALVSLDPIDGAVTAMVGSFHFPLSKYNRATQARRQPGSSFKPFIYSAALEHGFTTATVVPDAPVVYDDPSQEQAWRPENYEREFRGPMRLREALVASRNLVSIRVLRDVGIRPAIAHLEKFGFDPEGLPRGLSLALGSASVSPYQMASAYAVLANGGFRVDSYFIDRIEDANGKLLFQAAPLVACLACERFVEARAANATAGGSADNPDGAADMARTYRAQWASDEAACARDPAFDGALPLHAMAPRMVSAQNIYLVTDMMRDVVRRGTGRRAYRELGRKDLAGKTGTTNEQRDAWFSGFNADLVTTVWVGFDDFSELGRGEVGGRAALPAWIDYMGGALSGQPEHSIEQPWGLVRVKIMPDSGMLASADDEGWIYEWFRADHVPEAMPLQATSPFDEESDDAEEEETLF